MIVFTTLHTCTGDASRTIEIYAAARGVVHGELVGTLRVCEPHREQFRDVVRDAGYTAWSAPVAATDSPCGHLLAFEDDGHRSPDGDTGPVTEALQKAYGSREDDSESGEPVTTDDTTNAAETNAADVETTEDHAAELDRLLTTPGTLTQAVKKLNAADTVFGRLDMVLRKGGPVPVRWSVSAQADGADRERVTVLYDRLSSALRTTGPASTCLEALREACKLWHVLDVELRVSGAGASEPWER